ncbi:hypothetical protein [Archangium lipolyticum]|uniref:hypothetical protein n=1 Tax=Archangium lipolyticum TaxID=2970465 RepID=UPI00214A5638|nr:hypothetical protein [Archangium lipolyticum]
MSTQALVSKLLAAGLVLLLVSCGSTRHAAPSRSEELTGFVLVIEDASDGQARHSWQRASEFDLSWYDHLSSTGDAVENIVLASSRPRDCEQEHIDCFRDCMKRRLPSYLSHVKRGDGSKGSYCAEKCMEEYQDCLKSQRSPALEFSATHEAAEWLKRNRKELLVGTVVVIAGVAFVTLSAGAGVVVLAPVVLMAG